MTFPASSSRSTRPSLLSGALVSGVLATGVLSLSACGGGSDSPADAQPAASGAAAFDLKACVQTPPDGTVHTYANAARPQVEWKKASYAGELLNAQVEYADAARPLRIRYTRAGTDTQTLVAQEVFDPATGALTLREQYTGRTTSNKLKEGQSESVGYTVKTLFPADVADRAEQQVRTYVGNQETTFGEGRLKTCVVTEAVSELGKLAPDAGTSVSNATLHYAPGLNVVKRYDQATAPKAPARNQTVLSELVDSTATLTFLPDTAATQPTLADCNKLPLGLENILLTASSDAEATSARRATVATRFNNTPSLGLLRSTVGGELTQVRHLDPVLGYSTEIGREAYSGGAVTSRTTITGIPDLRNIPLGQSVDYTRSTLTPPATAPLSTTERATFVGHKKITTPAGTFDTCQVRFDYGSSSETLYMVPNGHWARLEGRSGAGVFTTRELIQR